MRHITVVLITLAFIFMSCNSDRVTTIVVEGPTTVNLHDIKVGSKLFGLTVDHVTIENEDFNLKLKGAFILKGNLSLSQYDGSLVFMHNEKNLSNAILQFNDMEIPLFMGTDINNPEELRTALGEEKTRKIDRFENVPVSLKFKNHQVMAIADYYQIRAFADFVELID